MPSPSDENGALKQIALLASSDSPAEEVVRSILDIARGTAESESPALASAVSDERISEIATIYEIGQAINALDLDEALRLITEKSSRLMNAQACSLLLKDPETEQLVIEASYGLSEDIVRGARVRYGEGIAGKVARTGEPMLILDVSKDPRFAGETLSPKPEVVASLCVPLKDEVGGIIGVLSIRRHAPAPPFTQSDLKLFSIFANQASLAITNAQLYARLNSRIQHMAIISDLLHAISSSLDLDHVLNQIAGNIMDVVGFDRCCVYLRDPRTDEFVVGVARGFATGEAPEERVSLGEGVVGMAAKEKIPIFLQSSRLKPTDPVEGARERQALALPVIVRDNCIGVALVDNEVTGRPIKPDRIELLSTFVNQAGIAIENARLYEAMEQKYAELNVLYEQSRAIGSAYGLDNAASLLVDVAMRAVKCDSSVLFLLDERRQELRARCGAGASQKVMSDLREASGSEDAAHAVRRLRDPLLISAERPLERLEDDWAFIGSLLRKHPSAAIIPLIAEDVTIGALILARASRESFRTAEMKLMSIIVSHAAVVLMNAIRYEERMREKALELSALYEFATRISSAASLEEALDSIVSIVAGLVQCDECVIYTLDHEQNAASAKAARRRDGTVHETPDVTLDDNDGIVSWVVRERKAVISPNIAEDPRFGMSEPENSRVMSLMSIPLVVQDDVVGVLNVHSYSPNQYTEDDVRVLSIIASQSAAIYKELEALSALTSYTDNILSSIAAGVITLDSEGYVLTWNQSAAQIVGLTDDQVVGRHYSDVVEDVRVAESDRENLVQTIDKVLRTAQTYQAYKLGFQTTDGTAYLNLSASQLVNSGGDRLGLVIIFEDVTREIEMEDQFRRMSELAAVGQLAASIAHELRNPLSSIKGAAQYLQKEYEDHSSVSEFLSIIIEEVNGLSRLTTEFLDFARPIQLELKPLNLNSVVEKTLQLMSVHIAESNVALKSELSEDLPEIEADGNQITQALRNVIINALQAMPSGGELTVETKPSPGRGAELWVHDTGVGIAADKLDRIFVPFFTTKTKGTGLGLSVVRKIVENHGGRAVVRSAPQEGTSFGIILPLHGVTPIAVPEADAADRRK
ncbi:MAG: GAF domain-containing protein [Armatimonadota bacterium]|nr:GAF domain-containing protein [Armatimonadota bacterium]